MIAKATLRELEHTVATSVFYGMNHKVWMFWVGIQLVLSEKLAKNTMALWHPVVERRYLILASIQVVRWHWMVSHSVSKRQLAYTLDKNSNRATISETDTTILYIMGGLYKADSDTPTCVRFKWTCGALWNLKRFHKFEFVSKVYASCLFDTLWDTIQCRCYRENKIVFG